jgi:hypothetical protein
MKHSRATGIGKVTIFAHAAIATTMVVAAIAASLVFVTFVETHSLSQTPPEHEVKADLFESLEQQANSAAAHFSLALDTAN